MPESTSASETASETTPQTDTEAAASEPEAERQDAAHGASAYERIFVPVDNSEHAMRCVDIAVELGKRYEAYLVGSHAYAAKMHDYRFKQMEFTLPEEYLIEEEMEKQRRVHDSLITMGLELISDSYLKVMEKKCAEADLPFTPKMYDGKNWKVITEDVRESEYDLVVIGALGLGAVADSTLGSVCARVVRRIKTDTLVVKNTAPIDQQIGWGGNGEVRHTAGGDIVVAVDGSPESYAGLKTALDLGEKLGKDVEAVSVYDPYLHYAMFNSIVNVLTEEASKVFKFEEQEQLHEEVIDTGLAKIYQSHLEVARRVAEKDGVNLKITLLDGKAFEKILQYVRDKDPWLLVLGRIGVHSDEEMDIGSNTENLLRKAPCNVLLSSRRYTPPLDVKAEESMTWTEPAKALLETAPEFAQGIAKTTTHRWAMERGHSVITRGVIEDAMATILPESAMKQMGIIAEDVAREEIEESESETHVCQECGYVARDFEPVECGVCGAPAEAFQKLDRKAIEDLARLEGGTESQETFDSVQLDWTKEAIEALRSIPNGYQRRRAKAQIEKKARVRNVGTITREQVVDVAGDTMEDTAELDQRKPDEPADSTGEAGGTPGEDGTGNGETGSRPAAENLIRDGDYRWTPEALSRLEEVPEGFMRDRTKTRMEEAADERDTTLITLEVAEAGIEIARRAMEEMIREQQEGGENASDPGHPGPDAPPEDPSSEHGDASPSDPAATEENPS